MRMMKTRSNIIVALILIALVSSLAFAQGGMQTGPGQQTTKGAVIKGKAPVNKEVLKVKLPRAEEATLKNQRVEIKPPDPIGELGSGWEKSRGARGMAWPFADGTGLPCRAEGGW